MKTKVEEAKNALEALERLKKNKEQIKMEAENLGMKIRSVKHPPLIARR